ncbi:MAG: hypothetical protein IMZ73_01405 [Chloroflexi bacterium]|nr:hypothetical protein [Chloroflexota bacterium]
MIRTTNSPLEIAAVTHPGMAGKQNEDRFAVSSYRVSRTDATPVEAADIESTVRGLELQSAAQALVDLACSREGNDNITVALILVPWEVPTKKKSNFWRWAVLGLAVLILLALVIVFATWAAFNFILPPAATLTPPP